MSDFTPSTQTLIHLGVEFVVLGGFAFWVHKRMAPVETTVEELNKKVAALENVIDKQYQILVQHEAIFRQLVNGGQLDLSQVPTLPPQARSPPPQQGPHPGHPISGPRPGHPQGHPLAPPSQPHPLGQGGAPQQQSPPQGRRQPLAPTQQGPPLPRGTTPLTGPGQRPPPPPAEDPEVPIDVLDEILDAELSKMAPEEPLAGQVAETPKKTRSKRPIVAELEIETSVPVPTSERGIKRANGEIVAGKKKLVKHGAPHQPGEEKDRSSYSRGRGGRRGDRDRDAFRGRDRSVGVDAEDPPSRKPNPKDDEGDPSASPVSISDTRDGPRPIKPPPYIDVSRLGWSTYHTEWCGHGCSNENVHYSRWRDAYDDHLRDLYVTFSERINSSKVSFNHFAEFVYRNSSGYISEYA